MTVSLPRVDFQKVSVYLANAGGIDKRPSKVFGSIIMNIISNSSCTTVHDIPAETTNSQPLFEKRLQQQSGSRFTLQGTKLVDIKAKTVKWEVSNFSPGRTFDTVRCMKDRLGGFLSEDISRRSMVSSRTCTTYKYTRIEGSKICDTYILQIQKGSSSPCANGQSGSISLFGKNERDKKPTHDSGGKGNMGILFTQSDPTYCRIPAGDFKYQGRQGFQGNEKFVKQMDIKQANISETDTGFRTSGCGSVCIWVVPPDPKVDKLATRSACMEGGCISNKLDTPKSICLPIFCSYR